MKPFEHMTRQQVEAATREDMLAYIERFKQYVREANAECLRECLRLCPDRSSRCADCVQGATVAKVEDGRAYFGDGSSEPLGEGDTTT